MPELDLQAIRERVREMRAGSAKAGYALVEDVPLLLEEIERLRAVTPEQVEAAAAAILEVKTEHGDAYYRMARAALEAARDA